MASCQHGQTGFCFDDATPQQRELHKFLHQHAYNWAEPAGREQAEEYATWYAARYYDKPIEDAPAHPSEFQVFLSEKKGALVESLTATTETYDFLDDPAERAWLIATAPADILANAHRIYDFLVEGGLMEDSFLRELAFQKAAADLGIDYDVLYDAWLNQTPVATKEA